MNQHLPYFYKIWESTRDSFFPSEPRTMKSFVKEIGLFLSILIPIVLLAPIASYLFGPDAWIDCCHILLSVTVIVAYAALIIKTVTEQRRSVDRYQSTAPNVEYYRELAAAFDKEFCLLGLNKERARESLLDAAETEIATGESFAQRAQKVVLEALKITVFSTFIYLLRGAIDLTDADKRVYPTMGLAAGLFVLVLGTIWFVGILAKDYSSWRSRRPLSKMRAFRDDLRFTWLLE